MTQHTDDLAVRLERLERENRRLKRVGGGLIAAVAAVGLMSAGSAFCKTVWAERLVLRDASGRDRLMMDAYGGAPSITMQDEQGRSVARFSWQEGVAMELPGCDGKPATRVKVDKDGKVSTERAGEQDGELVGMTR